jgi:exosortase family protein XrtM
MRFALKFVIAFALLTGIFEASRGTALERWIVEDGILRPATGLINMLTPQEHVTLVGRTIARPDGSGLRVIRGCEGIEMFLLLTAAILAFPASWRRRLQGLLVGSVLAYVLSITRLMLLHYILRYSPDAWQTLHGLVLPLGPVVLLALYFLHWSAPAQREAHAT